MAIKNISILGKTFSCDKQAYKVLRRFLKDTRIRTATYEDGGSIKEDLETALVDHLQKASNKSSIITLKEARQITNDIGLPELVNDHADNSFKKPYFLILLIVLSILSMLLWLNRPYLQFIVAFDTFNFLNELDSFIFGRMPGIVGLAEGLIFGTLSLVAAVIGTLFLLNKIQLKQKYVVVSMLAILAASIIALGTTIICKIVFYERITVQNNSRYFKFTNCGRAYDMPTPIMLDDNAILFNDALKQGYVFKGPISNNLNELQNTNYFDSISCLKLNDLASQNKDKKLIILSYKSGINGQILPDIEATSQEYSNTYFGLFAK